MDTMQIQASNTYECEICDNCFTSPIQLTVHCIVLHGLQPCINCLQLFNSEHELNRHTRANHKHIQFICSDCKNEFSTERELSFHNIRIHFNKQCQLCEQVISFDEYQRHISNIHKCVELTSIKLIIVPDQHNQYHCHLCTDTRSIDRLEKLFSHFLYFHKCSLQSLLRCILNDNEIHSLRSDITSDDTLAKCSGCKQNYSWSASKTYHKIYCQGFIYCANCNVCFESHAKYDRHSRKCDDHQQSEMVFCDNCNATDEVHLKTVHNFSTFAIATPTSSLINSHNDCQFCGRNLTHETKDLGQFIDHFRILHKFMSTMILSCLKIRKAEMSSVELIESPNFKRIASKPCEVLTIVKHKENTNFEYVRDFDASLVKYVYSSESDYDSSDSENDVVRSLKMYQCEMCKLRTRSKFVHAMHMHKKHGFQMKTPEFRCNVCRKTFRCNSNLRQHNRNIHHKRGTDKRFKCTFCAFKCNGKSKIRKHTSEHVESSYHPCSLKTIGFNCRYCHFIFWTKEKLSEHQMNRHSEHVNDTYLLCSHCFSAFNNLSTLRSHDTIRHIEHQQPTMNAFQCTICRIAFFSIDEMRVHMQEMHVERQSIYCAKQNCLQIVAAESELSTHWANEHATSVFQCMECFKMFEKKEFVRNHMARAHAKFKEPNRKSIKKNYE